jgi:NhaP-type Na+/H+ or K+/H+ antiporter
MPEPLIIVLTGLGLLIALVVWLPLLLRKLPLSMPIILLGVGSLLALLPGLPFRPLPLDYPDIAEHLSELVVIIALMGAGLKIDRPFGWRRWKITWRLLAFTMPLSIASIALLGVYGLGLSLAAALLLGSSLAPTDPVLASGVQVGPPKGGGEDNVRFGLTSEAGLNDGLAFPFVNLAIVLGAAAATGEPWALKWISYHVIWELAAGIGIGWGVGKAFGWLTFHMPGDSNLAKTGDGLIALAATLVSYGFAESIHSYGFLAVFVTALTLRNAHRDNDLHREMHDLTEQIERSAMAVVLLLFGGALASGLLTPIGWAEVGIALVIVFVVRPLAGFIGLIGARVSSAEKACISFFGIRGIGSFYYLAYGLNHMEVPGAERLWAIVGLICFISIVVHGVTMTPLIRLLDRREGRDPDAVDEEHAAPEEG